MFGDEPGYLLPREEGSLTAISLGVRVRGEVARFVCTAEPLETAVKVGQYAKWLFEIHWHFDAPTSTLCCWDLLL